MTEKQETQKRPPQIRLGPVAMKYVAPEVGDEKLGQKHVEAAFMKLEAALAGKAVDPDPAGVTGMKKSIERLSIEIAHFRFMLLACLCPDEEALQKELEKVHDRMNKETREMLIQYGIPTRDRDADMATFYRMQEAMRGEQEPDMEEER